MSHYVKLSIQAQQRFEAELVAALVQHFGEGKVESHGDKKVDLLNYSGQKSGLKGNIVVRKATQGEKLGRYVLVNDLGYERNTKGGYDVHVDMDGFPQADQNLVAQFYAEKVATKQLQEKGYQVQRALLPTGEIELTAQRYG
jgi:hypothetical protein